MNNFGVIELASAKTTAAPGWAYVPDVAVNPSAALQPTNRKRARNAPGLSHGDLSARQEAKLRKELEALDRDGGKDNSIPLPVKAGRVQEKHTPNVRKILQSQKTFANHLDDFLALQAQTDGTGGASASLARPAVSQTASNKRSVSSKKDASAATSRQASTPHVEDVPMADATADENNNLPPVLPPPFKPPPAAHAGDDDPLLMSRVPDAPSDAELRRLLAHPPLSYVEAKGSWETAAYPTRTFCAVCGYWGRVRCIKCGTRVCALDCLEMHREECVTRYGM